MLVHSITRRLTHMLLHGCTGVIAISVKLNQSFGKGSVTQALICEQMFQNAFLVYGALLLRQNTIQRRL
ncbi:hypothetical protein SDC9_61681 [bioreactor metagenome]|uniref:Uncharacterized protein n=1 Tax=bioreactor metagenome TaxID=1076179 RepID=A0A644XM40_9ZZZZ